MARKRVGWDCTWVPLCGTFWRQGLHFGPFGFFAAGVLGIPVLVSSDGPGTRPVLQ